MQHRQLRVCISTKSSLWFSRQISPDWSFWRENTGVEAESSEALSWISPPQPSSWSLQWPRHTGYAALLPPSLFTSSDLAQAKTFTPIIIGLQYTTPGLHSGTRLSLIWGTIFQFPNLWFRVSFNSLLHWFKVYQYNTMPSFYYDMRHWSAGMVFLYWFSISLFENWNGM